METAILAAVITAGGAILAAFAPRLLARRVPSGGTQPKISL